MKIALAVVRKDDHDAEPETELAGIERHGDRILVALDDGQVLDFDAWELIGAAAAAAVDEQPDDETQQAA